MLPAMTDKTINDCIDAAIHQAGLCQAEDVPAAGAVLTDGAGIVASGRTRRVEMNDPIRFAAMDCISNAGRRNDQAELTLCLSHEPNWLEAGTIVQFGIGRVVVGDREALATSETLGFLKARQVSVEVVKD